jgi:DNA-directed RNA polymerase sigma subunit (sigma70/sigma32)
MTNALAIGAAGMQAQQSQVDAIANNMGLTKGRISQIHKQAMERLRAALVGGDLDLSC